MCIRDRHTVVDYFHRNNERVVNIIMSLMYLFMRSCFRGYECFFNAMSCFVKKKYILTYYLYLGSDTMLKILRDMRRKIHAVKERE